MNKFLTPRFYTVCGIILLAALSRLLPHPDNFTPITAVALFGGAMLSRKSLAFLLPIGAVFVSDVAMQIMYGSGFYEGMWMNYLAFLSMSAIGLLLRRNTGVLSVAGATITASVCFFLLSNFGTWATTSMYPHTMDGLYTCYAYGLPFFRNTLLGDVLYSAALFGGFALAKRAFPVLSEPVAARA